MANESLVFDILARDGASPSLVKVGEAASEASGSLKDLSAKLKDVNGRTAAARVKLDGDKEAQAELDRMDVKLIRLGKTVANPNVKLEGVARARADISGIDLALDRLDAKSATATVGVSGGGKGRILGRLGGLFGGGAGAAASTAGGAAGGAGQAGSGLTAFAAGNPEVTAGAIGAAIAALPFIAQAAAGGIVTALGGGLAAVGVIGASKTKAVQRDFTDLKNTAVGAFKPITSSFDTVLQGILTTATGTLPSILGAVSTALQSIAGPFEQVGKIIAKSFGDPAVTTSVKAIGAAFGAVLKALAPSLPGIIDSIATGITRIANTIKDNPKAFADFIWFLGHVISVALDGIAALTSTATYIEKHFVPAMQRVANIFDGVRHEIAHVWDQIFQNSVGMVIRLTHNIETQFNSLKASVANVWDTIWRNTVTRVQNGIADVVGFFRGLPGRAVAALFGLGHSLAAFASAAISQMWTGFKNVWSSVIHWFESVPKMILNALGIKSPPHWAIDAGKHIMAGLHIGLGHGLGQLTSFTTGIGSRVAGALSGAVGAGAGVARWKPVALAAMGMLGIPSSDLGIVLSQMSTESGGNPTIVNTTDSNWLAGHPSVGLMQVIRGTYDAYAGPFRNTGPFEYGVSVSPLANIYAGLNYALHRYGAGWTSVLGHGHGYDQGGWLMPGVTLAVNKTGRPERVLPPGHSGGGDRRIVLEFRGGPSQYGQFLVAELQKFVSANGGNVQVALGEK